MTDKPEVMSRFRIADKPGVSYNEIVWHYQPVLFARSSTTSLTH
jgi:hypothetical protein